MKQIFKIIPDNNILIDLLIKYSIVEHNKFIINYNVYKKLIYENKHIDFLEDLKQYYFLSKHHYLNREFTYISFITIIRQLAKINNITYSYVYDKSMGYKFLKYTIYYNHDLSSQKDLFTCYF
jgi:hypothetical protein